MGNSTRYNTVRPGSAAQGLTDAQHGELMSTVLGKPWNVAVFLRAAIGIARALAALHRRGVVHQDLSPSCILIDAATGEAWLTGLDLSPRLVCDPPSDPTRVFARNLPYMAPEQSGRMNRSVDSRSDLYSFGALLYEMLTGTPPFSANEPMEWVHYHVARQPVPPADRVAGIPAPVSALVLKLLAKNPEDRYQTAGGVESDLRKCLFDWESTGHVEPFALAERDVPDWLLIPERLYGREREVALLVDAFERVLRSGRQTLGLVSGHSGVGKSSVVNELQRSAVNAHGLFASGKFESHERDVPFAPIVRAFREMLRSVLLSSDAELQRWRERIMGALGDNAQLIIDLVPEVGRVIGPQKPVVELPPQQAQARFRRVLQRFIAVFASSDHPMVLFVDDLQWVDRATLDLLRSLTTSDESMHLLVVGAYRDNEVGPSHPLAETLSAIRSTTQVLEITLGPLERRDVGRLIADTLHQTEDRVEPLAEAVYEKTAGSPFFVIHFFRELADEGCLAFDDVSGIWSWDLIEIHSRGYTENVFDLLAGKLDRLSTATRAALRDLAFISTGRRDVVRIVFGGSADELDAALSEAIAPGLVSQGDSGYAFAHDRIREAAYAQVPEGERAAVHLRIGRTLLTQLEPSAVSEHIFEVVSQLNRGLRLVTSEEERLRIAELNLTAGQRARASCAYVSALTYLAAGESIISDRDWEEHYRLRFALALGRAECEFLTGALMDAGEHLVSLKERSHDRRDLVQVACLRMAVYTTLDRIDLAIQVGLEQLRAFGVEWSTEPPNEHVRAEYDLLRQRVGDRAIEDLLQLPSTNDSDLLDQMAVLEAVLPSAAFFDKNLHDLAVIRMARLSVEHGVCAASTQAFAHLSLALGPRFGDDRHGYRYGNLAVALAEREELARLRHKVYCVVAHHVLPWTRPLQAALSMMRRAIELAQAAGDPLYAAFSANHLISIALAAGVSLELVQSEAEGYLESARGAGYRLAIYGYFGKLGLIRALRGLPVDELETPQVERPLQDDAGLAIAACFYWTRRLEAYARAGDYAHALEMKARAEHVLWTIPTFFEIADYHFYAALAHAGAWNAANARDATAHRDAVASHQKQLAVWAQDCMVTFGCRDALAAAELARIENRELDAERLYEEAIRGAHAAGAVNVEAIASERAAQFYVGRGLDRIARTYLLHARVCYGQWGADGMVRRLTSHTLLDEDSGDALPTVVSATSAEGLDLATAIKASQAVAGEIQLDKLVETLMVTAIQQAGAERGVLIVKRGDDVMVEADAITGPEAITVSGRHTPTGPTDLPDSLVRFILRSHEPVILDDASASGAFAADPYVVENRARSVMGLPLLNQGQLVGVLYLENNLLPRVFTRSRIALLELIASQAAISLENAYLYSDLREAQAYLAAAQRLSTTASFGWRPSRGEIVWSDETYRIFEIDHATRPTMELVFDRTHPDDRERLREAIEDAIARTSDWEIEHRLLMPNGTVKYLHVVSRPMLDEATGGTVYVGAVMDVTGVVESRQALEQANAEIQAGLRARYQAALEERSRIAQELHDTLLQDVAGVALHLKTVELALTEEPELAARTLAKAQLLTESALRESRARVWDMRTQELDESDLAAALDAHGRTVTAGTDLTMTVTTHGERRRLTRRVEVAALRIGHEALANVVKHAGAHTIEVDVDFGRGSLGLEIRDDGRGFTDADREVAVQSGHFGLVGMQERAQRAGGSLSVGARPEGGTVVTLQLPLAERSPAPPA